MAPLLSVLIPVYNEELTIERTLASVLNQNVERIEVVIVDDQSTDEGIHNVKQTFQDDPRIKVVTNERKKGIAGALNTGLKYCAGEYIARIDAGDTARNGRFNEQLLLLANNLNCAAVGCPAILVNENHEEIGYWNVKEIVNAEEIYNRGGFIHSTMIIRREIFKEIGGYREDICSEDVDLFLRILSKKCSVHNLKEPYMECMVRRQGLSYGETRKRVFSILKIKLKFLVRFFSFLNVIYTLRTLVGCVMSVLFLDKLLIMSDSFVSGKRFSK